MTVRHLIALTYFIFLGLTISAQGLYHPRNIDIAYKKGTRDLSGKPGKNYWQNRADYKIKMDVFPPKRAVHCEQEITYYNNSPDTLHGLNFKLFANHHKPGAMRAYPVPEEYLSSGIHIFSYSENGEEIPWDYKDDTTDKFVKLSKPLLPNDSVKIEIAWYYYLSERSGREGAISENSLFIAYFYPRIAVYDDYVGWDRMPHTMAQEFYNDFNNYTFEVTVPKNYLVWATGELQNAEEILLEPYLDRYKRSQKSDLVISIVNQEDLRQNEIVIPHEIIRWKWKAENVSDIAIAISSEYNWDASSTIVDKRTGRRASVQAAYSENATDFRQMVNHISDAITWFSEKVPGWPYPYPTMTVVQGHADMEYPMMANDSSFPDNPELTRSIAQHEIAHSYFPFFMGTNETRYGFMDEGWATALQYLTAIDDVGYEAATESFKRYRVSNWINDPSFVQDIPIITPSNILNRPAMSNNMYGKAALAYLALRDMLGEDLFRFALHEYMNRWNGKHPMPWDFFYTFNNHLKNDLNWFWNSWFFSNNYIDLAIERVSNRGNKLDIYIKNIGGMVVPFDLIIEKADGSKETLHYTPEIWKKDQETSRIKLSGYRNIKSITIDGGIWMDADISDNIWGK